MAATHRNRIQRSANQRRKRRRNRQAAPLPIRHLRIEPLEDRRLLSLSVAVDQSEYFPGQPIGIVVSGLTPGETAELQVLHIDGTANLGSGHDPWQIVDGGEYDLDALADGNIQTTLYIDREDMAGSTFETTVKGLTSGEVGTAQFAGIEDPGPPPVTTIVETDKLDYQPGETATVSAAGFAPGETIEFLVLHVDDIPNTGGGHEPWQVTDGSADDLDGVVDGNVQTTWYVNEDDSLGSVFNVTATGLTSGDVARAEFTDHYNSSTDVTLLSDSFESDFSSSNWDLAETNAYRDYDRDHKSGPHAPPYGNWAAAFNGKELFFFSNRNDFLTSRSFDLRNYLSASLYYSVQPAGHEDWPWNDEDNLLIEYQTSSGTWVELAYEHLHHFSNVTDWHRHHIDLPQGAFHSDFKFRFNATASDMEWNLDPVIQDYWFIDLVRLYADPNENPTVTATAHSTGTHDDVDAHRFTWSAADPDGNLSSASARLQRFVGGSWQDVP